MLMITTSDGAQGLSFRLEGQLAGPWVQELAAIWNLTLLSLPERPVCVDLAAVTYIDTDGFALLTLMARQGASINAPDSLNQSLVEEIKTSLRSES